MITTKNLPQKEHKLFKDVLSYYEEKNYKKALRLAEEILSSVKNHPETLSLKALILKTMNRSEEGYDIAKLALKESKMSIFTCWYIYAQMFKMDKNYFQAIKSYMNAYRLQPDNLTVLKELILLLVHARDYQGHMTYREKLLTLKPGVGQHWIGYAIACYLAGNFVHASKVIDTYFSSCDEAVKALTPFEFSEILLFQNLCLQKAGDAEVALNHLNVHKTKILDKIYFLESSAQLLKKQNKGQEHQEAISKIYHDLLTINPDNHEYIKAYQVSKGFPVIDNNIISKGQPSTSLLEMYEALEQEFPKSQAIKRFTLSYCSGENFRKKLFSFASHYLQRAIPSLFNILKGLYLDQEKGKIIEEVFLSIASCLESEGKLNKESETYESPTTIVWAWKFLAHHFDVIGDKLKAISYIDKAISHTPTITELYSTKGLIYKHGGNLEKASECVEKARLLDQADRYLNTKAIKYLLHVNEVSKAEDMVNLFTKHETEFHSYIFEMQVMWFEVECGLAHLRLKDYGKALRMFVSVRKHFQDIFEDQMDFHTYSLRKMAIRAYLEMMEFMDKLYSQKFYYKAACAAIRTYLHLADSIAANDRPDIGNLSVANSSSTTGPSMSHKGPLGKYANEEKDLESTKQPLEEASSWMKELLKYHSDKLETNLLAIDLYSRRKKYLRVAKAIRQSIDLSSVDHPQVHTEVCVFFRGLEDSVLKSLPKEVAAVLLIEKEEILGSVSVDDYNDNFANRNTSLAGRLAACNVISRASSETHQNAGVESKVARQKILDWLTSSNLDKTTLQTFREATTLLKALDCDNKTLGIFEDTFHKMFPLL